MTDSDHATFAPSAADQWGPDRCPASIQMQQKHPADDETEASREGTQAHFVATELVRDGVIVASNQEMADGAKLFYEAAEGSQWVEKRLSMHSVHPECFGTPDAVRYDTAAQTLEVIDYKYGHGYVEHWHNPQLLLYAIGALEALRIVDWSGWSITLTIVQPRYYGAEPVRSCKVSGQSLQSIWLPRFREAARLADDPGALCKTGPWCRYCSALLHCEAARKMQGAALDYTDRQESGPVTAESVGAEMTHIERALRVLKDRQTALEAQAAVMPRVAGWSKEPKYGRLAWNDSDDAVIELGDALGTDLRRPPAPITPTQAKKLVDESVIAAYAERPFAGIKLVPERNAEEVLG